MSKWDFDSVYLKSRECWVFAGLVGSELNFSRITSHPRSKVNCVSTPSEKAAFTHEDHEKKCLLVQMCGITSARDDVMAAEAGANFIGMIL